MAKYKVLIAEDNVLFSNIVHKILSELNIDTHIVSTGREALNYLENDYYDMVLIDIMIPELDGLAVSKHIRKNNKHTPIVALTSIPYDEIKDQLTASGINHYIGKPPKIEDLRNLLLEYFKAAA